MQYDFARIEARWQEHWAKQDLFAAPNPGEPAFDPNRPKFYVLDMFPFPSGYGLHVGHPLGYIATDIVARYKRMRGFNVLHPMGYDSFGLPTEQFALEHGVHPRTATEQNIANMTRQLKRLGLSFDWNRQLATTDPSYYRWTQWIFLQLYQSWFDPRVNAARPIGELVSELENFRAYVGLDGELVWAQGEGLQAVSGIAVGLRKWHELDEGEREAFLDRFRLAYMDEVPVNWCPALGTVLANAEVTNEGRSERGNHPVYRRPLNQWLMRITAYAERLLEELELVSWPESTKELQRNWIGKSRGAEVDFPIANPGQGLPPAQEPTQSAKEGSPEPIATPEGIPQDHSRFDPQRTMKNTHMPEQARQPWADPDTGPKASAAGGDRATEPAEEIITVFTTRPDTLFGATYMVLAPEHPLVDVITTGQQLHDVQRYIRQAAEKAETDRTAEHRDKSGVFTGAYAINPVNGVRIPIWIADYVLMGYGTGAIMAVPAHDERDFEFAKAFDLPIVPVVSPSDEWLTDHAKDVPEAGGDPKKLREAYLAEPGRFSEAYTEPGEAVNSANDSMSLNGQPTERAKPAMIDWLESQRLGRGKTLFRLRDWLFSRQRYWGEPFPILHGPDGQVRPVPEEDLPVELPPMEDFRPEVSDDPNAPVRTPLSRAPDDWKYVTIDGVTYTRELNTMPNWAGSCWYYLRFIDPNNAERFVGKDAERYWMYSGKPDGTPHAGGVDLYVGGVEHAVLHLLYARFWHKVLYDLGYLSTPEPFGRLFNQGYIQAFAYTDERGAYVPADEVKDQEGNPATDVQNQKDRRFFYGDKPVKQEYGKMGKSLKNAVTPDYICEQYGCDTLRLYEMYLGPLEASKQWNTRDIIGVHRFLQRLWRNFVGEDGQLLVDDAPLLDEELKRKLHQTIEKVDQDMERMSYNTAIAALIELNNDLVQRERIPRDLAEPLVLMLSPIAPHIAEELWSRLGHESSLAFEPFPEADPDWVKASVVELPVQINGKVRHRITVAADADQEAVEKDVLSDEKVQQLLEGKAVQKVILVPNKMVNIVAK